MIEVITTVTFAVEDTTSTHVFSILDSAAAVGNETSTLTFTDFVFNDTGFGFIVTGPVEIPGAETLVPDVHFIRLRGADTHENMPFYGPHPDYTLEPIRLYDDIILTDIGFDVTVSNVILFSARTDIQPSPVEEALTIVSDGREEHLYDDEISFETDVKQEHIITQLITLTDRGTTDPHVVSVIIVSGDTLKNYLFEDEIVVGDESSIQYSFSDQVVFSTIVSGQLNVSSVVYFDAELNLQLGYTTFREDNLKIYDLALVVTGPANNLFGVVTC